MQKMVKSKHVDALKIYFYEFFLIKIIKYLFYFVIK